MDTVYTGTRKWLFLGYIMLLANKDTARLTRLLQNALTEVELRTPPAVYGFLALVPGAYFKLSNHTWLVRSQ